MFKKLFSGLLGGDDGKSGNAAAADPVEYKGYLIISEPADQYRVSGWIRKPLPAADGEEGQMLEHRFERSDMLPGREACDALMVSKAQRYIDQIGDEMFSPR
ncbi:MAG: HlyU family transcriptional regulator [Halomonas sp.]|uniref:HlyU family transcriptional regulator n=1 Tax=Halomonas sp. TaxID=1486246 RepID=UPI002ACD5620|nr:HlyU family transcriptional regulator [Halomonas sp.]MDZ7851960.1 HlyU family transcriptional regulator [Halomonas sp.]